MTCLASKALLIPIWPIQYLGSCTCTWYREPASRGRSEGCRLVGYSILCSDQTCNVLTYTVAPVFKSYVEGPELLLVTIPHNLSMLYCQCQKHCGWFAGVVTQSIFTLLVPTEGDVTTGSAVKVVPACV